MNVMSCPSASRLDKVLEKCEKEGLRVISIDIETTGLDCQKDHICQIGAVSYTVKDRHLTKDGVFNQYCKIPIKMPSEATAINGITDQMLANANDLQTVLTRFRSFCGESFVALIYNAPFDYGFLKMATINLGPDYSFDPIEVLDCYRLVKFVSGFEQTHLNLDSVVQMYGVQVEGHMHDAVHDAEACAEVFNAIIPKIGDIPTPRGVDVPIILDVQPATDVLDVTLKYYGHVFLDPYTGMWISEFDAFDRVNLSETEEAVLIFCRAHSLRDLSSLLGNESNK